MLRRTPVFYGWVIVAVIFVSSLFAGGIGFWGIGVFVKPMEDDLGWSRTAIFTALSIRAFVGGGLAPFIGPWLDSKHGPRVLAVVGSAMMGLSLIGLRYIDEVWQFHLLYGVAGALSMLATGPNMAQVIVPKWFVQRRGRTLGIATMGTPLAGVLFPIPLQWVVSTVGWREAWFVLGIATTAVLVPTSLLIRTRPEDVGLLPDGGAAPDASRQRVTTGPTAAAAERSLTRSEALRTRSFWLLLLAVAIVGMGIQGFQPNWFPYFQDIGFSTTIAAAAIAVYGIFAASARLIWGTLAEGRSVRNLIVAQALMTAAVIVMLLYVNSAALLFAYVVIQGLTLGGHFILQPLIVANYFGRAHLGAVRGIMRPFLTFSGAAGPIVVAALFDATGSYRTAFMAVIGTWVLAALVFLLAPPPGRQVRGPRDVPAQEET